MGRYKVEPTRYSMGLVKAPMHQEPTRWDVMEEEGVKVDIYHSIEEIAWDAHKAILMAHEFAVMSELQDEHHWINICSKHPLADSNEEYKDETLNWQISTSGMFHAKPYNPSFGTIMKDQEAGYLDGEKMDKNARSLIKDF